MVFSYRLAGGETAGKGCAEGVIFAVLTTTTLHAKRARRAGPPILPSRFSIHTNRTGLDVSNREQNSIISWQPGGIVFDAFQWLLKSQGVKFTPVVGAPIIRMTQAF